MAAVEDAASSLVELGHTVSTFDLEPQGRFSAGFPDGVVRFAATQVPDWGKTERKTREQAEIGRLLQAPDYLQAISALHLFSRHVVSMWEDYDLLLTPTLAKPPFRIGTPERFPAAEMVEERFRFSPFTPVFNVTGQPAVSLPLWWNGEGLPLGCSLRAAGWRGGPHPCRPSSRKPVPGRSTFLPLLTSS